ncbi:UDP-glycosyltransferase 1-like [Andrographis paniculata]|uniref:UDP-glycosyltransferase 1-like n=1 Tax=Andrographis paniculata TaxID=175694 RepID=UPI0021E94EC1|nr:UDP-glycosyltransferase 1-like [Andrographis paniculata]
MANHNSELSDQVPDLDQDQDQQQLHIVMIPLMAPGHIIPIVHMAKVLARRGLSITLVLPPLTAARFRPALETSNNDKKMIRVLPVPFPAEAAGLPPDCETVDRLPSNSLVRTFYIAIRRFQQPVEAALRSLPAAAAPAAVICDKHLPWTAATCAEFQIPRIIFDGMGCFAQLVINLLYESRAYENRPLMEPFPVPGLPDPVKFCRAQLPGMFNPGSFEAYDFRAEVRAAELQAYGVVINTFEELETSHVAEYRRLRAGKVWCVGPLSLAVSDDAERGENPDAEKCLKWLDGKNPGSVVYACLGSLSRLPLEKFVELALGLETSNRPFILAVRGVDTSIDDWIRDDGFEDRVCGTGLLVRGWAPQVAILSHGAVGGFLTHCGWNSTLEGISAGVPMMTWPMFADQFLNEKLAVEILGVGVGVGARGVVHLGEEDKVVEEYEECYKVTRDGIREAIERVMKEDEEEGMEMRKRVRRLAELAKKSVDRGGSSCRNLTLLIREIGRMNKNKEKGNNNNNNNNNNN